MAFGSPLYGRSSSVHGGIANAEGLQMRLGDDFQPMSEVLLPASLQIIESSLISGDQYPFDVEESFLDWIKDIKDAEQQQKEILQQQEKLERERKRIEIDESRKRATRDESDAILSDTPSKLTLDPKSSPVGVHLGTDILVPTPSDRNKQSSMVMSDSSNHLIDLADFENASDPFEAAELQTLNVMEELKTVLASSTAAPPLNGSPPHGVPPTAQELCNPPAPTDTTEPLGPPTCKAPNVSTSTEVSEITSNSHIPEINTFSKTPQEIVKVTNSEAVAFKKSKVSHEVDLKSPPKKVSQPSHSQQGQSDVDHEDLSQSLDSFILHSSGKSHLLNSAPLPPIKKLPIVAGNNGLHKEGTRGRSSSSPVEVPTGSSNHKEPPGYPKNLSKYTPLPPSRTGTRPEIKQEDPDLSGLDEESRNFAMMITSMGFPKARTARAVKRLGHDDKMVIDALCALDRLCNKGYSEERVEEALHLLDNDDEKILMFLKLMKQFEELGFKPDDIKRELLLHGNEEEKILDALTAKP